MERVSPVALTKLKDALTHIYWYKRDLRSFLQNSLGDSSLLTQFDWENTVKRQIIGDLVDGLAQKQDRYLGYVRRLIKDVVEFDDFGHLELLEDGDAKAKKAKEAVVSLRELVMGHDKIVRENESAARLFCPASSIPCDVWPIVWKLAGTTCLRQTYEDVSDSDYKTSSRFNGLCSTPGHSTTTPSDAPGKSRKVMPKIILSSRPQSLKKSQRNLV